MDWLFNLAMNRVDALAFALVAIGAMLWLHRWARRVHRLPGVSWRVWLLLAACMPSARSRSG